MGFPDAIAAVWLAAVIQTCVIHLIRNTFRYALRKYWIRWRGTSNPCTPPATEAAAKERFAEFAAAWGQRFPAIIRQWENARPEYHSWTTTPKSGG